jgi:hypothetical protein
MIALPTPQRVSAHDGTKQSDLAAISVCLLGIVRHAALDRCPALARKLVDRRMEIDFIGKLVDDGRPIMPRA